jgi:hypothetical protein
METSTNKTDQNYCKKHQIQQATCTYENCVKSLICKFCAVESKEELLHLIEHYDNIKDITSENGLEFKTKVKEDEMYGDLNTAYIGFIDKSNTILDTVFGGLLEKKLLISEQVGNSLFAKYEEMTVQFETLVKSLSDKLNSMSTTDNKAKEEFRKIKKDLDEKLNFLTNPSIFSKKTSKFI